MNKRNIEPIKELRNICNKNEKEHWYVRCIMRGISIYPTKLFLKIGISANQTTLLSMIIGIIAGVFLAIGEYWYSITGALLFNLWLLFDLVDGQIARYNGTSSALGSAIDSMNSDICYAILFVSVGIGVYDSAPTAASVSFLSSVYGILQYFDPIVFAILGMSASLSKILQRFFRFKLGMLQIQNKLSSEKQKNLPKMDVIKKIYDWIDINLFNQIGFLLPLLVMAAVFGILHLWIIFYGICLPVMLFLETTALIRKFL